MDKELVRYILDYFSNLMTTDEKLALQHHMFMYKTEDDARMRQIMIQKEWISQQDEVKKMLDDGFESFERKVAERILRETPDKVFLNTCLKCHKLARTPFAKQCRHCGYDWHD